jgi:GTP-binding protein HflX
MLFERPESGDKAVLLHVELHGQDNPDQDEFAELARSAQINVVQVASAKRSAPHPRWFVGSGKVDDLKALLQWADASLILINHDLSPGQQRNLEQALECRMITRTELILTIFAERARSHEGQLQVELAQLKHAQTRLVRGWTHLDRQKGGIGMRGAGEKQIELDQRMLSARVKATEQKLQDVARRRRQNRRSRNGKSTLFNAITQAEVFAQDLLFATLDPTTRKIKVPGAGNVVMTDTVGFVSALPHALVEAFKATLEEVVHSDLLLHVVDGSDPLREDRIEQVQAVLDDIGAAEVPSLIIVNKADLMDAEQRALLDNTALVSALTGQGVTQLLNSIGTALGVVAPHQVVLSPKDGKNRAWLYQSGAVLEETLLTDGSVKLTVQADDKLLGQMRQRQVHVETTH